MNSFSSTTRSQFTYVNELSDALFQQEVSRKDGFAMVELARKAVFKSLESIRYGSLLLEEDGKVFHFGKFGALPQAKVKVNDPLAYKFFAVGGNVGGAEAYMLSYWDTKDLLSVTQLFAKNINVLTEVDRNQSFKNKLASKIFHFLNKNSLDGSKKNISAHYDLGNKFFELFLDESMMYSSAIFQTISQPLAEASINKLDVICKKLELKDSDHLVEIGTGWGGMAIYAASNYGCRVTTTTISEEQYQYTLDKVQSLGLQEKVTVLKKDYRLIEGRYDKLVSIEMIEAVGAEHLKGYFEKCSSLIKEDGLMLVQAITIPDQRYQQSLKSVDFIQKYIFPGGRLPSNGVISENISKHTDLQIVDHHDIGEHYAMTLSAWRKSFLEKREEIKSLGFDEVFYRMWDYYFCYCEGGFSERAISTVQYVMAKPHANFNARKI
jgi:cyclopropane-fatty-acyl-phospholipid synthase